MPTFEYVASVRCIVDAPTSEKGESIVREELEGACIEIESFRLIG